MRVRKVVKIDEAEFVVRELTLRQIIDLLENTTSGAKDIGGGEEATDTIGFFTGEIQNLLTLALEGDHKVEDFYTMAPSELKTLYDGFKEVNVVFFDIAAKIGFKTALDGVLQSIQKEFSEVLVSSSKAAMRKSLTTGTPTSSPQ